MILGKASSLASDAYIADKAIIYLKRHPHQLQSLLLQFTPSAAFHLLLRSQSDKTVFLKFLNWASPHRFFDPQCKCHALHVLTRLKLFKTAQSLAQDLIREQSEVADSNGDSFTFVFNCLKDSYHAFSSSSAVFDLMVKSYSSLNMLDAALNTIALAKSHGFMPSVLSYNSVLDAMIRSRIVPSRVEGLYNEMLKSGISANVFTYNIMIKGCCSVGELGKAVVYFEKMQSNGCLPSVVTYNTLMDAYCKAGDVENAFSLMKSMTVNHMEASLVTYNVIINGLCRGGRMQDAYKVIDEMKRKGLLADEVTYNTMVNGYCKEGDFHQALVLQEEMLRNGLCPDVVTYTALINGMCKAKNMTRAMQFLDQMRSKGLQPNQRTYTTLIDGFAQQGFLKEAYQLLKEMLENGFPPSEVTYNTLINGHCALGKMDDALNVINDMVEKGLMPDVVSYSAIVSGFCKDRELDKAFQMKQEMVTKGILPDTITYSTLIQGLCGDNRLHQACDLFNEMLSAGLASDEFTYTTLMNAYCREGDIKQALKLHNEMIQKGFLPDVVTYSVLINGLMKQARTREAKKLLMKLYYEDRVPIDITYNTLIESCSNTQFKNAYGLIKGFCMKGLMNEADKVFKSMIQKGHKLNNAVYDVLIHGHSKSGDILKAYDLYKEMVRLGFTPHAVTVVALLKALSREEMSKELSDTLDATMRSCKVGDAELAKSLVEINHKEGNMDAVLNLIAEMAKDGLLPNVGRTEYGE